MPKQPTTSPAILKRFRAIYTGDAILVAWDTAQLADVPVTLREVDLHEYEVVESLLRCRHEGGEWSLCKLDGGAMLFCTWSGGVARDFAIQPCDIVGEWHRRPSDPKGWALLRGVDSTPISRHLLRASAVRDMLRDVVNYAPPGSSDHG